VDRDLASGVSQMSMDRPNNSSDAWDIQCQSSATTTTTRDATDEREARERRAKVAEKAVCRSVFLTIWHYFEYRINKKRTPLDCFFGDFALWVNTISSMRGSRINDFRFLFETVLEKFQFDIIHNSVYIAIFSWSRSKP